MSVYTLAAQAERGLMLAESVGHYLDGHISDEDLRGELGDYMARMAVLTAEERVA